MESISWDEYFMSIAELTAKRSKDPSTKVGACIVDKENRIVGTGYNGMPRINLDDSTRKKILMSGFECGVDSSSMINNDKAFSWERGDSMDDPNSKYPFVIHAEQNAILNSTSRDLSGCKMYVTLFPCNVCAKLIVQSGITELIYQDDKYFDLPMTKNAKKIFDVCQVRYNKYTGGEK